jgi:hypothetical protein
MEFFNDFSACHTNSSYILFQFLDIQHMYDTQPRLTCSRYKFIDRLILLKHSTAFTTNVITGKLHLTAFKKNQVLFPT